MPQHIPSWTTNYLSHLWQPPFGCFFLVAEVLREEFDIDDIPDYTEHELLSDGIDTYQRRAIVIKTVLDDRCTPIDKGDQEAGDIVTIRASEYPIHIGIVVADNWMLHCSDGINTVISRLDDPVYKNRIEGFYRVEK